MSGPCPLPGVWEELLAHRFDPSRPRPSKLDGALEHLDGCAACRERALRLDPLLVFRGARSLTEPVDSAAMVEAVRVGRRLRRLERPSSARSSAGVAAALIGALLLLTPTALQRSPEAPGAAPAAPAAELSASPLIENLDRPGARVYQWGSETVSVVMVVDESLDV